MCTALIMAFTVILNVLSIMHTYILRDFKTPLRKFLFLKLIKLSVSKMSLFSFYIS